MLPPAAAPAPAPADWLSRLLDLVPVRGRLELRCQFGAPWAIDEPPAAPGAMRYHAILGGGALLDDPAGGPPRPLRAGDILLLPGGDAHRLHDGSGAPSQPAHKRPGPAVLISENGAADGARLDMLCGHFLLSPMQGRLLRDYLPARLVVASDAAASSDSAAQVAGLLALMRRESVSDSLGARAMLDAFSTALFALVLRRASETGAAPTGLLALAGHPRLAPALSAMFADPAHPWTLEELAALCHMSRATAARQFEQQLGRSAAELLTDIRMTVAAAELVKPNVSTGAAADAAGYQSEAAFQRAFKARMGLTPAQWRKQAMGSADDR